MRPLRALLPRRPRRIAAALGWTIALVAGHALPAHASPRPQDSPSGTPAAPAPTVFLWLQDHREAPPPGDWIQELGGAALETRTPAAWLLDERRPSGIEVYLGHAAGRDELHLVREHESYAQGRTAYRRSRQPAAWPRTFDPFAPDAFEQLSQTLKRNRQRFGPGPYRAVSLGDEIGLTPFGDPVDHAVSPSEALAWRQWLAAGGSERFGLQGDAQPIGTGQALRGGTDRAFAAFLARRCFERESFSALAMRLAREAKGHWPGTPVALLGIAGETAWHGLDLSLLARELGVFEPYGDDLGLVLCDTLRSLGNGRPQLWRTLFANGPDAHLFNSGLETAARHSVDALVLWSDRALKTAPDRLRQLQSTLQRWPTPALPSPPRNTALLHDFDSLCRCWFLDARGDGAAWPERLGGFQDAHGTLQRAQRKWLDDRFVRGLGADVLPIDRLGEPAALMFTQLVAIELRVLDRREHAALREHLVRGGQLKIQGEFARLRPDGSRWPRALLADWSREFPGQIRRLD